MIEVIGSDGRTHSFADGTTQAQIDAALAALNTPPVAAAIPTPNYAPAQPPPYSQPSAQPQAQYSPTQGITQTQMLMAALAVAVIAFLGTLVVMLSRDKPAPTIAQTPTAGGTTMLPTDPLAVPTTMPAGPTVTPEAFAGFVTTQQGGNVIVRGLAAQNGAQIGKLPHGAPIAVTGSVVMPDGLWRQVSIGGTTGYIKGDYISQTQPAAIAKAPVVAARMIPRGFWGFAATRTMSSVNVRTSPSMSAAVTSSIPTGESVYVVGEQGAWYLVEWNGKRGWANSSYIAREDRD